MGDTGYKGAMSSLLDSHEAKAVKQSLAGVDLGSESYAEALMDPSHPSVSLTPSLLFFFTPIHRPPRACHDSEGMLRGRRPMGDVGRATDLSQVGHRREAIRGGHQ